MNAKSIINCLLLTGVIFFGYDLWNKSVSKNLITHGPIEKYFAREYNFGDAYMGDVLKIPLEGKNTTSKTIKIVKLKTSCGCALADLSNNTFEPGEAIPLQLTLNTKQKSGNIRKAVYVYIDGQKEPITAYVSGTIKLHKAAHEARDDQTIFSKECTSCHVNPGRNELGYSLYLADCAFCHGVFKEKFDADRLVAVDATYLKKMMSEGNGLGTMPAFGMMNGGPLNKLQIESLISFLKDKQAVKNFVHEKNYPKGFERGEHLYKKLCVSCHGQRRKGPIGASITKEDLKGKSEAELVNILSNGSGLLMPSFLASKGGVLTMAEIKDVAMFLKVQDN